MDHGMVMNFLQNLDENSRYLFYFTNLHKKKDIFSILWPNGGTKLKNHVCFYVNFKIYKIQNVVMRKEVKVKVWRLILVGA